MLLPNILLFFFCEPGPRERPKVFIPTVLETGFSWFRYQVGEKPLKLAAALLPEVFSANLGRGNHQQAHSAKQELLDVVRNAAPLIVQIVDDNICPRHGSVEVMVLGRFLA